jgi:hypothetical protein
MGANLSALANAFLVMAGLVPAIHVAFVRRYGLTRLAYFEHHEDIWTAIQREPASSIGPRLESPSPGGRETGARETCIHHG